MPVDFLTSEQKANYGQFSAELNEVQLARYFHLDEADLAFINHRHGNQNRFGDQRAGAVEHNLYAGRS
jgi:hypothetical protein